MTTLSLTPTVTAISNIVTAAVAIKTQANLWNAKLVGASVAADDIALLDRQRCAAAGDVGELVAREEFPTH
jgi:hypothetical protein